MLEHLELYRSIFACTLFRSPHFYDNVSDPFQSYSTLLLFNPLTHFTYWQGVTKRCRLSLLTKSALVIRFHSKCGGRGGVPRSQPMSTAVYITNKLGKSTWASIFNLCLLTFTLCPRSKEKMVTFEDEHKPPGRLQFQTADLEKDIPM